MSEPLCEEHWDGSQETLTTRPIHGWPCIVEGCGNQATRIGHRKKVALPAPAVYEIDLSKKYMLSFPIPLSELEADRIRKELSDWMKSDQPFLIITGDVKLVRVDEPERIEVGSVDNE